MPFGAHETMEVHEMLNEKINLINHFQLYAQQCQSSQLKDMIHRHLQTAIQAYDQLVRYTHDYQTAQGMSTQTGISNIQPQQIQYGLNNPPQLMPQMQQMSKSMDDQQIAMAVLSCHKNSAKNHMQAAVECADPNVRQMLVNGSVTCSNQAYEVFTYMNQQGLYQVPTLKDHTAKTYLHAYQPVQQEMPQSMQQGMTQGMQQPAMQQMYHQ
ncbi:spore coat protein [Marinicrinis lubricantis]|uniref:Spore coat protein n=1 Tax=Marinicrinis lubricantis TaxID=2086470 RepID=A0ABW1ITC2_9BACL